MSSVDFSFVDDSSSDEEFDLHEEEEIAMLVAMHKRKKPKHGGSVYGRASIGENGLMRTNGWCATTLHHHLFFRRITFDAVSECRKTCSSAFAMK